MKTKGNLVLYLDKELVEKSKDLGFNLSKTFENHLKQLMMQFSTVNSVNNCNSTIENEEKWAGPDLNFLNFFNREIGNNTKKAFSLIAMLC